MNICVWHLCTNVLTGRRTKFCSLQCKNKYTVTKKRRNNKEELVKHFGSMCVDCGYTGPPFMFDFDHLDPQAKTFGLADGGVTKSFDKLVTEASKCDLVCARCHRMRTHLQRCNGCEYCGGSNEVSVQSFK